MTGRSDPIRSARVNTGNAGALARHEREARNGGRANDGLKIERTARTRCGRGRPPSQFYFRSL